MGSFKCLIFVAFLLPSCVTTNNSSAPTHTKTNEGLTNEEVLTVIKKNIHQVRICYEEFLKRTPESKGYLRVKYIIGLDGSVETLDYVKDESTIMDETMRNCVSSELMSWKYPKPRGQEKVTVSYPFRFNPL